MADEEGRLNGAVEQEEENTEGATDKKDEEQTEKRSDEKDEVTIQENGSEEHNKENSTQEDVAEMDTTEKEEEVASSDKSKVVGTSAEEKNEDKEDAAVVTNGEEVEGRRQETEVDTETKESQKVTTSESSRSETSIETSAPVQIVSKETEASADQSEESKDQEPEEEDAAVEKTSSTQAEVVEEQQPEPQPETEEDQKPAESVEKVDEAVAEISEPEIKAQLEEIIKEIDDTVDKEDVGEEKQEEGAEEEQVYHTWKPKGKYEIEATPILREDVVPIDVAEVPEPPPVELPPPVTSTDTQESANDTSRMMQQQEPIGPITVPQLLPNGELGSPIEIPEGIPLLARILPKEEGHDRAPIPLERLFTPATDSGEITPRKKKAFASSDFYAPNHPTIDDQLQLAQNISKSLIDQNNKTSRGQAMYEKRKQRSVKWIHQEGGKLVQQEVEEEEEATGTDFVEMNDEQPKVTKPAMKLVMNPKGVQDHTTVEQHYQQLMEQSNMSSSNMSPGQMPASPEIVRDIITDMQSPTGKGAALFAKRKKRMDKFIVDETNVQKSSAYQQEQQSCVQSTTTERSTVNQFSSFSSSSNSSSTTNQPQKTGPLASSIPVSNKKKSLQERDKEQQRIMEEFMKNRESQFQIVKTPWEAVLETGNTSAAFKQNMQTKSSTMTTTINAVSGPAVPGGAAAPPWLEMPQPVPVTAPLPRAAPSAPLPTPPSPFGKQAAGPPANEGAGGTGLVYTAEVKVQQPSGQPKGQNFQPSAPAPFTPPAPVAKPAAAAPPSQPLFAAPVATKPAPVVTKPAPVVTKPVPSPSAGGIGGPGFVSQAEAEERRKSMNFNLAANGWGNYNKYYRPISFAS